MHFTYASEPNFGELYQGDLIARTPEVDKILGEVHPHYGKSDYKAFVVLTQSCDLAIRDGKCGARYISLAAVRPLSLVLRRAFAAACRNTWEEEFRITSQKTREKMRLFIARLLNNNEDEYFYLRRDAPSGLTEDCCVFLQLSVAVKADMHYGTLLAAKKLELEQTFQHKLGYLVGKMYSRVGTPDWVPSHFKNGSEFEDFISEILESGSFAEWLEEPVYKHLTAKVRANGDAPVTPELLTQWIAEFKEAKAKRRQEVLDAIEKAMLDAGIANDASKKAAARIKNSPVFSAAFKS